MRILVTFAVEPEFSPWSRLRRFDKRRNGLTDFYVAQIGDAEVNVLLTGIGGKNPWLEATKLIWDGDVNVCVSSGLAGALREGYGAGDILAAKRVQAAGWNRVIMSDGDLLQLAVEHGAKSADFYTSNEVVKLGSEKRALGKLADAVEMESGEVLYEASAFGAKVIAVRGISDTVDEDLPIDFNRVVTTTGEVSVPRVVGEVIRHPQSVPALVRFGKQSRMAAEKLCVFLDHYVPGVVVAMSAAHGANAR